MKVKEESEKSALKLNIQNAKIMTSYPITSWQIEEEKVEAVTRFVFLDSKITAVGDCSHEIKGHLLLGRKAMTNLNSILKSRAITLPTKVYVVKAIVFPVVMYRCESESHSVVSESLGSHGLYSPWNSPGQNTGVDSFSLLQGIFPTQGLNPGLQILNQLSHQGSPRTLEWVAYPFSSIFS